MARRWQGIQEVSQETTESNIYTHIFEANTECLSYLTFAVLVSGGVCRAQDEDTQIGKVFVGVAARASNVGTVATLQKNTTCVLFLF